MPLKTYHTIEQVEVGIDEVGRGCLAGPVVAAAVIWPQDDDIDSSMIKDSKMMSESARVRMSEYIKQHAIEWQVNFVDNTVIDKKNILQATFDAMHNCLDKLSTPIDMILVDGDKFRKYHDIDHTCVVKGDQTYVSIAAASILAKHARDQYMIEQSMVYSNYNWENNMGYGTKAHNEAIMKHGLTPLHRKTFCTKFVS